jgi:hypothetical protein
MGGSMPHCGYDREFIRSVNNLDPAPNVTQHPPAVNVESSARVEPRWKRVASVWAGFSSVGTLRLLKNLLKWMNVILGSLASACHAVEPFKEVKGYIEASLD